MSSPAPAAGAVRPSHALFALALSLLLGLQPATTDIYLPALPLLTRELAAPMSAVQLTMSAMILSFGIAQLVWGPVADRIGRRPVLISGLLVFTVASVGSAVAPNIEALVAWRVLQGATLAASVVCARAMLRDLYEPHEGAQVMALGLSGLGAVAIGGPIVGGLVAAAWGWRATLAVVALCGALTLAFVVWRLPETLPRERRQPAGFGRLGAEWAHIVRHRTFIAWTRLVSASYGTLFLLLASSSFVYMDVLGLSAAAYGLTMAAGSTSYLAGTMVCRRWIRLHGLAGAVRRGGVFTLAGGLGMLGAAAVERPLLWMLLVPHLLFSFGHGIHQPCAQAGAVGPFPRSAGAASALAGFLLAFAAFVVGLWLGRAIDGTARPLTLGIGCGALVICLVAWTLVQRNALAPADRAS